MQEALRLALRTRFGPERFRVGMPPDPIAVFAAKHPEVGQARVLSPERRSSSMGAVFHVQV